MTQYCLIRFFDSRNSYLPMHDSCDVLRVTCQAHHNHTSLSPLIPHLPLKHLPPPELQTLNLA
jgi:hypothetical protein